MKQRKDHLGLYFFDRASGFNCLFDEIRFPASEITIAPRHLSVALTNACDLSCAFCYASKVPAMLDYESVVAWCLEADAAGTLAVGFGGGEPTLFPRFTELCREIHERTQLAVTMTTHGHWLSSQLCRQLTGHVDFIRVSMDGVGDSYELSKGKSFASFIEKLGLIRDTSAFGINIVITHNTIEHLEECADFALAQGARQILLLPEMRHDGTIALSSQRMDALQAWLNTKYRMYPISVSIHASTLMNVPVLPVSDPKNQAREHLHIDALGYLRPSAFSAVGLRLDTRSLLTTIHELEREKIGEELVRIRQ